MFLCRLESRRQIGHKLRNGPSKANFETLFGVETFPHGDTLNDVYRDMQPEQMQEAVCRLVETLIRKKTLSKYRLFDRYYKVAIDGTGIIAYHSRHCEHCLTQTKNGKTLYYHSVLEAKLVTSDGLCFSLMSEFIENPEENPTKQDCELKAFYRLAERLKKRFPFLPIVLLMDGLFAGGPTFTICGKYNWRFIIVLKDDDLPSVNKEFEALWKLEPGNRLDLDSGKNREIKQKFRWVNKIFYEDSNKVEHALNVLECLETDIDNDLSEHTTKYKWVSSLEIKPGRVSEIADGGGRNRWTIENEGFNVQKNGFELEHAYSKNPTAAKIFYFLLQIAHIFFQLIRRGSLLKKSFPKGFGSAKNIAFLLLEAWRNAILPKYICEIIRQARFQIRFDAS